jgi:HK97 gp10 family phage protein
MDETVTIKGLSALNKMLETLPGKLQTNIMRGALRAGARPIVLQARANIHSISYRLARSIRVSVSTRGGRVVARIVSGGTKAGIENRPIWVEFGTRPHLLMVRESDKPINVRASVRAGRTVRASMTTINRAVRQLGSLKIGTQFVGPVLHHPGARPYPFMRPALDQRAAEAAVAVGNYIKERLEKQGLDAANITVEAN